MRRIVYMNMVMMRLQKNFSPSDPKALFNQTICYLFVPFHFEISNFHCNSMNKQTCRRFWTAMVEELFPGPMIVTTGAL